MFASRVLFIDFEPRCKKVFFKNSKHSVRWAAGGQAEAGERGNRRFFRIAAPTGYLRRILSSRNDNQQPHALYSLSHSSFARAPAYFCCQWK